MRESKRRPPGNVVSGQRGILPRQEGKLEFVRHAEVRLELSVFSRKFGAGDPEPIPLFLQGVFHVLHSGKILINATDADDFASGVPQGQFAGVIPADPATRINELLDLTNHWYAGLDDPLFVRRCLSRGRFRPEVKVSLTDQVGRLLHSHKFRNRSADAGETAFRIFEVNLIRRVLQEEREKILLESDVILAWGRDFFHSQRESSSPGRIGHVESQLDALQAVSDRIPMVPLPDPPAGGQRTFAIDLTFHDDLVLFLRRADQNRPIRRLLSHKTSVKDLIEACGVPHPEVDLITVNGKPVDLSSHLDTDAMVEIYPVSAARELFASDRLQTRNVPAFVADGHLGKLTRDLRLLGIDVSYRRDAEDRELLITAVRERRALLTRDRRLLMHRVVQTGYYPRSQHSIEQTVEVIKRFNLAEKLAPFQRCLQCNERLNPVPKEMVLEKLEPLTRLYYHEFRRCSKCGQIYWRGSHYERLRKHVEAIIESIS
jgi:uncharacterized protein